jgi:hypothetical protein
MLPKNCKSRFAKVIFAEDATSIAAVTKKRGKTEKKTK